MSDFFISYAHVDDLKFEPHLYGWVTVVTGHLNNFLIQNLGRESAYSFWKDHRLQGNDRVTPVIKQAVTDAKLFLAFFSRGWMESSWCKEELEIFQETHSEINQCIFVIEMTSFTMDEKPKIIQDLRCYPFWRKDIGGLISRLGNPLPSSTSEKDYWSELSKLSEDMCKKIKELQPTPTPTPKKKIINPYIAENSVGGSSAFVGRANILDQIINTITHSEKVSLILHGQRRIGKTSILNELEKKLNESNIYHTVFFDLTNKTKQELKITLIELAKNIHDKLKTATSISEINSINTINNFDKWILEKLNNEKPLVLLLDELDELILSDHTHDKDLTNSLSNFLYNYLINNKKISVIFTIGCNTNDLQEKTLRLMKGLTLKTVSLLTKEDTINLVRLSEKNESLFWKNDAIDTVWDLTHGHPYLTQLLCSQIWEYVISNKNNRSPKKDSLYVTASDVNINIDNTLRSAELAFRWLWKSLSDHEKIVCVILAKQAEELITYEQLKIELTAKVNITIIHKLSQTLDSLEKWDFLSKISKHDKDCYRLKVKLIRFLIRESQTLERVLNEIDNNKPKVDNHYFLALEEYKTRNYEDSLSHLNKILQLNPTHAQANELYGDILYEQGEVDAAIQIYYKTYQLQPARIRIKLTDTLSKKINSTDTLLKKIEIILEIYKIYPEKIKTDSAINEYIETYIASLIQNNQLEKCINIYQELGLIEKAKELEYSHKYFLNFEKIAKEILNNISDINDIFVFDTKNKKIYSSNFEMNNLFLFIASDIDKITSFIECSFTYLDNSCFLYIKKDQHHLYGFTSNRDITLPLLKSKINNTNLFSKISQNITSN